MLKSLSKEPSPLPPSATLHLHLPLSLFPVRGIRGLAGASCSLFADFTRALVHHLHATPGPYTCTSRDSDLSWTLSCTPSSGAVACHAYGHRRETHAVDVLVNAEELQAICKTLHSNMRWKPRYKAARRGWVDISTQVNVNLLVSGEYPGDGLPKPVSFPHLTREAGFDWIEVEGDVRVLGLVELVSIKLASAASAPHRHKDAADVSALIEAQRLPREFVIELDVSVRPLYVQLWEELQQKRASGLQ